MEDTITIEGFGTLRRAVGDGDAREWYHTGYGDPRLCTGGDTNFMMASIRERGVSVTYAACLESREATLVALLDAMPRHHRDVILALGAK